MKKGLGFFLIFIFSVHHGFAFGKKQKSFLFNHVKCLYGETTTGWELYLSAHGAENQYLNVGQGWPLSFIWWQNGRESGRKETGMCSHITNVTEQGEFFVRSTIHDAVYFEDADSESCEWIGKDVTLISELVQPLRYGEKMEFDIERPTPLRSFFRIIDYIPTHTEMNRLNPDFSWDLCQSFLK